MADECSISDTVDVLRAKIAEMSEKNVDGEVGRAMTAVRELLEAVCAGDSSRLESALELVTPPASDHHLFEEIGKLTRNLHSSLCEFRGELAPKLGRHLSVDGPKVADQIQSVITMTNEATHKVLALLEQQSNSLDEEKVAIEGLLLELGTNSGDPRFAKMEATLKTMLARNGHTRQFSNDILMAQEFQDLTGQILKRVMGVVTDVENSLVSLVRMFGLPKEAEQPQVQEVAKPAQTCNQDDVNDLLASLGF